MDKKNILLVGLGPHSKRIYIRFFRKFKIIPKIIIDLDEKEHHVKAFLRKQQLNITTYFIPSEERNLPAFRQVS